MTNLIKNKIDKIFSEELNNNRKLILKEGIASNKFVRKSLMNNMDDNFKVIKKYQKRKSQEEIFSKHMKFMNDNDDNDITIKNKTKKLNDNINNINPNFGKITKVQTQGDIKNYFGDVNILIDEKEIHNTKIKSCINKKFNESESGFKGTPSNSKRTNRNAIILVEEKPIEEHKKSDNKLELVETTFETVFKCFESILSEMVKIYDNLLYKNSIKYIERFGNKYAARTRKEYWRDARGSAEVSDRESNKVGVRFKKQTVAVV